MRLSPDAKRLAVFAYFDEDGIVDDYIPYLVRAVGTFCTEQIAVVNGALTPESEAKLRPCVTRILYRENEGFDITGYKAGLFSVRDRWPEFDEVLFYNQTIFGPVCPLDGLFRTMGDRDVDFWGLTRHKGARHASWDVAESIAPHVQSFFFAVRGPMLRSPEFLDYWENLPAIKTYWDAVGKHEVVFTKHFADLGFSWDVYIHTEDLEQYNDYPMMGMPALLLAERGCPFFKRKSFLLPRRMYSMVPQGEAPRQLWDYLDAHTDYPLGLVAQNLTRTGDITTVTNALTPYYDLPPAKAAAEGTAVVLWFDGDALGDLLCRAARLQRGAQVFALFSGEELMERWLPLLPENTEYLLANISGLRVLFTHLWDKLQAFRYLLYLNNGLPPLIEEFADATTLDMAVESLAASDCGAFLEAHPAYGLVVPPVGSHQECLSMGLNWPKVSKKLKGRLAAAGLRIPLGEKHAGLAVRGGMFFARTAALAPLAGFSLRKSDSRGNYPAEEFLPPLAAQAAGYLTAFSCREHTAFNLLANQANLLTEYNELWATPVRRSPDTVLFRMEAIRDFYYERRFQMTLEQAFAAKLSFKQKLWITLQIWLKPETFARLRGKRGQQETEEPSDLLD